VIDLAGRRIATPWNGVAPAGERHVSWDGTDTRGVPVAPGVYVVRLAAAGRITSTRLLRVR